MTAADCPDPHGCPVPAPPGPVDARRLRTTTWPVNRPFFHVHEHKFGYDDFNPGRGEFRFAPIAEPGPVSTLYAGADEAVTLIESVFHDLAAETGERTVVESALRRRGLAHMIPARPLTLLDLRDPALRVLGLARSELVSASAEHYRCTRGWGTWLHARHPGGASPDGLVWHSRQAELTGRAAGEVLVLWGDRAPSQPGSYELVGPGVRNLVEGPGRVLVEEIAESLGALIVPG
jgi:hypothetical protein